ncbi:MAG: serine--tRNA ligase [Candidatus Thermoplasmatota archaeon]|nr:serine--tRNA ligase [Candidatus Thermoplasmatota archaeon]
MIDIGILRKNPEILYESQRRRFQGDEIIRKAISLDDKWRELLKKSNDLKSEKNRMIREIAPIAKRGEDISAQKKKVEMVETQIGLIEKQLTEIESERDNVLRRIPNIVDLEAPVARDESGNTAFEFHGKATVFSDDLSNFLDSSKGKMEYELIERRRESHVDLLTRRGLIDLETAAKVSGSRFYYLLGDLVILENAIELYALKMLREKGFTVVEPPFMLNKEATNGATDFTAFEDTLYKVEGEDLYLIATSEHPLASYHSDQILEARSLPQFYAGRSPCFRREAGAHGKDTKGIFRVHQFNKIEQFAYCLPEDSAKIHRILLGNAKEFYDNLKIPYRIVDISTGDLGNVASRKFDIEAWYPVQGQFREVVSASNVLDYQARRLKIRYRANDGNKFVHTLNSTLVATTRTLVAIVENNQQPDGTIMVPEVLQKYVGKEAI